MGTIARIRIVTLFISLLVAITMAFTACGPAQYTLSTEVDPSGAGMITPDSGTYDAGAEVTLVATAASGYAFDHWSGDVTGTSSPFTFFMDSNKSVTAHFKVTTGVLKGRLIGAESGKAQARAAIILGLMTTEKKCSLKADLVTVVEENGSFQISNVPAGSYILFYDLSGKAKPGWKDINGLEISINFDCLVAGQLKGMPGVSIPPEWESERKELFSTFGGGGTIITEEGTTYEFKDGVPFVTEGSFVSEKYGLQIDFRGGKPIVVEIKPESITSVEIKAWNQ